MIILEEPNVNYGFAFFPGQGAQAPGMGKDLYENSQAAKLVLRKQAKAPIWM